MAVIWDSVLYDGVRRRASDIRILKVVHNAWGGSAERQAAVDSIIQESAAFQKRAVMHKALSLSCTDVVLLRKIQLQARGQSLDIRRQLEGDPK